MDFHKLAHDLLFHVSCIITLKKLALILCFDKTIQDLSNRQTQNGPPITGHTLF